jgi:hypothetical protein
MQRTCQTTSRLHWDLQCLWTWLGCVIIGEHSPCIPRVFCLEWPNTVKSQLKTVPNQKGAISNSDLEMAGLLMLWLVIEKVASALREKHVALSTNNSPSVSWVTRLASKSLPTMAARLIRALSLRLKLAHTSPITTLHIPDHQNAIADIPSW